MVLKRRSNFPLHDKRIWQRTKKTVNYITAGLHVWNRRRRSCVVVPNDASTTDINRVRSVEVAVICHLRDNFILAVEQDSICGLDCSVLKRVNARVCVFLVFNRNNIDKRVLLSEVATPTKSH